MTESLSSRERARLNYSLREADRPAFSWSFGPQPPARAALNEHLAQWGLDYEKLFVVTSDLRRYHVPYVGPPLPERTSFWGWTVKPTSYGAGSYDEFDHQPLATAETIADIERHLWPDPDHFDCAAVVERIGREDPDGRYARIVSGGNPMEILSWLMGLTNVLVRLLEAPEVIHAAMDRITAHFETVTRRVLELANGRIDAVFCADDLGTQRGPMIGRDTYRRMIMPYHRSFYAMIHEHDAFVIHHSDGSVAGLLDDLIAAGVDCLEAVQVECADMAPESLKARFGGRIAFQGGVSVQQVLPHRTPEEVRREVRRLKETLGAGGGYLCTPSHAIQAGTPPENVVAMAEEAVELTIDDIARLARSR